MVQQMFEVKIKTSVMDIILANVDFRHVGLGMCVSCVAKITLKLNMISTKIWIRAKLIINQNEAGTQVFMQICHMGLGHPLTGNCLVILIQLIQSLMFGLRSYSQILIGSFY